MDSIHLHGAEDVRSAGNTIRSAADTISSAASTFDSAADRLCLRFDEAIVTFNRLAEALEKLQLPPEPEPCPECQANGLCARHAARG